MSVQFSTIRKTVIALHTIQGYTFLTIVRTLTKLPNLDYNERDF